MNEPLDLQAAIDSHSELAAYQALFPLGVCQNCPRPAQIEGLDGYGYCGVCAKALARQIIVAGAAARHCHTPAQRKARAKRRKARKANR